MIREAPVRTKRWTRLQYERAIDRGVFRENDRLELLDGVLVVKEPQGEPYAAAIDLVALALRRVFGEGWLVRLVESVVEVRRDPGPLAPPARAQGYRSVETFRAPAVIAPLAAPGARIAVADLLP